MHARQDKFEAAAADCTAVLASDPENVKAMFRRGQAYAAMGDEVPTPSTHPCTCPPHRRVSLTAARHGRPSLTDPAVRCRLQKLSEAKADLLAAAKLSPKDKSIRKAYNDASTRLPAGSPSSSRLPLESLKKRPSPSLGHAA